jgi:hypothetical protein
VLLLLLLLLLLEEEDGLLGLERGDAVSELGACYGGRGEGQAGRVEGGRRPQG